MRKILRNSLLVTLALATTLVVTNYRSINHFVDHFSQSSKPKPTIYTKPDSEERKDIDNDGVLDRFDNCPLSYNPTQLDTDRDGLGDICDNCPLNYNPSQQDTLRQGMGDECNPNIREYTRN